MTDDNVDLYVGIDIGGTKCSVILGDKTGRILEKIRFPTKTPLGPEQAIDALLSAVDRMVRREQPSAPLRAPRAIGISCGGPLDHEQGIIQSPPNLPGWDDIHITEPFETRFGIPAYLQNDADACALAEHRFGAGVGCKNMVFLTFGTGLGGGIILNGRLYGGSTGMAGEVGHIRLADDGPVGYGKSGSFEGFCSGGGIAQLAQHVIQDKLSRGIQVSFLSDPSGIEAVTAEIVGNAALAGDIIAREILEKSGHWLGRGLAIIIDMLNPQLIIIGSIFARCRAFLQPAAEEVIRAEALPQAAAVCRIEPPALGESIGDMAALCTAIDGISEDGG